MIRKTYKYRLYPTKLQVGLLERQLAECCRLYNAALQERRDAYRLEGKSISLYDQTYQLKEILGAGDSDIKGYSAAWYVLDRVNKTFQSFFRRVKERKGKAGFPRFKSSRRYDSFDWQCKGSPVTKKAKLRIPKLGEFEIKLHRPINGAVKHCHVKRSAGRWYASLSVECEAEPLTPRIEQVGIDVGLTSFATLSDGTEIDNPRYYREAQAKLRRAQRKVARRKKGGNGRRKAVQLLQRANEHVRNQRSDFHHKISKWLIDNYGLIAVEDLNVKGLAGGMLAKSVHDAGWGMFLDKIAYKAESAGRDFFRVNPSGTSQNCSGCGHRQEKSLSMRIHQCDSCSLILGRDHNAAINILQAGLACAALTCPAGESVAAENPSTQAPDRRARRKKPAAVGCLRASEPNASG